MSKEKVRVVVSDASRRDARRLNDSMFRHRLRRELDPALTDQAHLKYDYESPPSIRQAIRWKEDLMKKRLEEERKLGEYKRGVRRPKDSPRRARILEKKNL